MYRECFPCRLTNKLVLEEEAVCIESMNTSYGRTVLRNMALKLILRYEKVSQHQGGLSKSSTRKRLEVTMKD